MPVTSPSRLQLLDRAPAPADFEADVLSGLGKSPKSIPPQHFYDTLGSVLFEAICELPEYYVTRCETEILQQHAREMAGRFSETVRLVELGSGSARKTRYLIEALLQTRSQLEFLPLDIDARMLTKSARALLGEYSRLSITGIVADFRSPAKAIPPAAAGEQTLVAFLGSSIGNLDPGAAAALLTDLRTSLSSGDALLLGVDLKKEKRILDAAYDDALGVTASFNRNLLLRMNRDLGADFDLPSFTHRAFYDETLGRIEMHLVSTRRQSVHLPASHTEITFEEGETIHTENSYKHDEATLETLAAASGFEIEKAWSDSRKWFADVLMRVP